MNKFTIQQLQQTRPIGKVFKFEDVPLMRVGEGLKPISDYSLIDEWQVCLRLHGTIQDPALLLLIHDIQHNRSTMEKLNAFDLLAIYRVSRGESIRDVDTVTLKKLLSQGLLVETDNGIKLTPLYEEMKLRAGVIDRIEDQNVPVSDTVNVPISDAVKLSQLIERQQKIYEAIKNVPVNVPNLAAMLGVSEKTIKRDISALQSAGLIKRVGSDKTGHWEVIDKVK